MNNTAKLDAAGHSIVGTTIGNVVMLLVGCACALAAMGVTILSIVLCILTAAAFLVAMHTRKMVLGNGKEIVQPGNRSLLIGMVLVRHCNFPSIYPQLTGKKGKPLRDPLSA